MTKKPSKKKIAKKPEPPKGPQKGAYKLCPNCQGDNVESREDFNYRVRHYMCVKCNKSWEVPHRVIDHDLPFQHKP